MADSTNDTPNPPLTRMVGCICGLAGFAIAIVAGLSADNPADVILARALVGLAVCGAVGAAIGAAATVVINESISRAQAHARAAAGAPATEPAPNESAVAS